MKGSNHPHKIARVDDSQLESHDDSQQDPKDSQTDTQETPKLAFKKLRIMSEAPETDAQLEQKLRLTRAIFDQYLKSDQEQQATEQINAKLGAGSVSRFQIAFFFANFRSHHFEVFKDQIKRDESMRDDEYSDQVFNRVLHTHLFKCKDDRIRTKMLTIDGRIAFFPPERFSQNATIIDLFAGTKRSLKVFCEPGPDEQQFWVQTRTRRSKKFCSYNEHEQTLSVQPCYEMLAGVTNFVMLDQKYLLSMYSHEEHKYVFLFELDYKKWTLEKVDMHVIKEGGKIIKDLLDNLKFVVVFDDGFMEGRVGDNKIYLKEFVKMKINGSDLSECKLETSKLSGIRKTQIVGQDGTVSKDEFVEIDLEKQKQLAIELPRIESICEKNDIIRRSCASAWQDSKLYVLYEVNFSLHQLFVFDTKTNEWTRTQLKIPKFNPKTLFVDKGGMITIHAYKEDYRLSNNIHFFYRFSLNQPDSLLNMTWLTIQNHSRMFNINYLYQTKLPNSFEFAPRVPNEH